MSKSDKSIDPRILEAAMAEFLEKRHQRMLYAKMQA